MVKSALLSAFFLGCMALSAVAQERPVSTCKERQETTTRVMICVDGDIDWVYRSRGVAGAMGLTTNDATNSMEYNISLTVNCDLTEKVNVFARLAVPRDAGSFGPYAALATDGQALEVWDLYVKLAEFLDPGITLQVGTQNELIFDVRGTGQSLVFNPGRSASPNSTSTTASVVGVGSLTPGNFLQQVAGVSMGMKREAFQLTVAYYTITEGGPMSADENGLTAYLYYDLPTVGKGSRFGVIVSFNGDTGKETSIMTFGGAVSLKDLAMPGLELYLEFYVNSGDAGTAGTQTLDAAGSAIHLGGKYVLPNNESASWVELNITILSGDGDTAANTDVDNFLSYESVSDAVILEDPMFGINVNTNMTIIKIMGGMSFTAGTGAKNNVQLKVVIASATTSEDVNPGVNETDKLGTEIDVKVAYWISKAVAFDAVLGFLTGSDVLELATGGSASSSSETSGFVFAVGFRFGG